jgi:hypothetical protein
MRFSLKSGFSSSVALAVSVACSGSVDTHTGTSHDRDAGSADGGRSSGSGGANGTGGRAGTGGAGRGGTSTGGTAGGYTGGAGGQDTGGQSTGGQGTGGAENDPSTTGTLTGSCAVVGAYGCAGHAQKGQLICTGTWAANGNCAGSNNCDTTPGANAGSCQPILTECLGKKPGDIICYGDSRVTCGPDIVTVIALDTCATNQFCEDGVCKTPCYIPDGGCP